MATPAQPPELQIQDLLDAGLHFGHQTKRWNPKMNKYIFGSKNGVYIIDLAKTSTGLRNANRYRGGMELTLQYIGAFSDKRRKLPKASVM